MLACRYFPSLSNCRKQNKKDALVCSFERSLIHLWKYLPSRPTYADHKKTEKKKSSWTIFISFIDSNFGLFLFLSLTLTSACQTSELNLVNEVLLFLWVWRAKIIAIAEQSLNYVVRERKANKGWVIFTCSLQCQYKKKMIFLVTSILIR